MFQDTLWKNLVDLASSAVPRSFFVSDCKFFFRRVSSIAFFSIPAPPPNSVPPPPAASGLKHSSLGRSGGISVSLLPCGSSARQSLLRDPSFHPKTERHSLQATVLSDSSGEFALKVITVPRGWAGGSSRTHPAHVSFSFVLKYSIQLSDFLYLSFLSSGVTVSKRTAFKAELGAWGLDLWFTTPFPFLPGSPRSLTQCAL